MPSGRTYGADSPDLSILRSTRVGVDRRFAASPRPSGTRCRCQVAALAARTLQIFRSPDRPGSAWIGALQPRLGQVALAADAKWPHLRRRLARSFDLQIWLGRRG